MIEIPYGKQGSKEKLLYHCCTGQIMKTNLDIGKIIMWTLSLFYFPAKDRVERRTISDIDNIVGQTTCTKVLIFSIYFGENTAIYIIKKNMSFCRIKQI